MIELRLSVADLAAIRFARSPLEETLESLSTLADPRRRAMHRVWLTAVRARLAALDLALPMALTRHPTSRPDFLSPPLEQWNVDIDDELELVRAAEPDMMRREIAPMLDRSAPLRRLYDDPQRQLGRLVDQLRAYWRAAIEPAWPRLRALHDADLQYRAAQLTRGGAAGMFADLHPEISYSADRIWIDKPHYSYTRDLPGRGLLLVPCVFAWPRLIVAVNGPCQPGLGYAPRGVGEVWQTADLASAAVLPDLIGGTRAQILARLDLPLSTTRLATHLGMTPPTVSHHLSVLRRCGLVSSHRAGREVLYQRTELGDRLLEG